MVKMSHGIRAVQPFMMHHIWAMLGKIENECTVHNRVNWSDFDSNAHYRSYISFDILRRVLSDYFDYNVLYVMNITDIDDKIIKRARQNYLYDQYVNSSISLEQILSDHKEVLDQLNDVIAKNTDADKKTLLARMLNQ